MGGELRKFIQGESHEAKEAKSFMDQGLKVPNTAIIKMAEEFIAKNPGKKILMDGVIRSKEQNDAISPLFENFAVLWLDLDEETAVKRISGRRIDPITNETFPASFTGETNPKTGNVLITRADDTPDAIRKRIAWSIADTLPLIEVWKRHGHQIFRVDAAESEDDIFTHVEKMIKSV